MKKDKKWLTDYLIKNLLTQDCVSQLPDDEIKSLFEKAGKDFDVYSKKRYGPLKKNYVKEAIELAPTKSEYDKEHDEEKFHVTNNLDLTRSEMEGRNFSIIIA